MLIYKRLVLFCFCLVVASSCANRQATPPMSKQDISFQTTVPLQTSPKIEISDPEGDYQIRYHYTKTLYVKNLFSECVVFSNDFGVSIWHFKNEQWLGIKNLNEELNPDKIILEPKGEFFSENVFTIFPDYNVLAAEQPSSIRVFISGRLCKDGKPTDQIVGNYIDVKVVP